MSPRSPQKHHGSISIIAVLGFLVAVSCLMVIDVAHVFSERRAMQKIADMAAESGVQMVDQTCSNPVADAKGVAAINQFNTSAGDQITVTCGRWDPARFAAPTYFSAGTSLYNAVQVTVSHNVPYFFAFGSRTVSAAATAKNTNVASFSLGTGTASVNNGLINQVLSALLGSNVNLSGVAYTGIVNSTIKLGDLVTAVNAGSVNSLLNSKMTAGEFLGWVATVLQPNDPLTANILSGIALHIPSTRLINLGSTTGVPGILAVSLGNVESAASAQLNVFDLLMTTAELMQVGQPALTLASAVNLPPVATATVGLAVIQAPVIAIGEAGQNAAGQWITSATSSQVRLLLNVNLLNVSSLGIPGLTGLQIPFVLDVAPAVANLTKAQCTQSRATCEVDVQATPGLASICVGAMSPGMSMNPSTPVTCNQPAVLAKVPGVIEVTATAPIVFTPPANTGQTFVFNGITGDPDAYQSSSSNVGGLFESMASTLASQLTLNVTVLGVGLPLGTLLRPILTTFVDAALNPVLAQLDTVLVPMLQMLGVQVGNDTVHFLSLECGDTELVY